jgi:hypothetical protein
MLYQEKSGKSDLIYTAEAITKQRVSFDNNQLISNNSFSYIVKLFPISKSLSTTTPSPKASSARQIESKVLLTVFTDNAGH